MKVKLSKNLTDAFIWLFWNSKFIKFTKELKLKPDEALNEIIRFSTVPGTSRHHWGTEIDIIDEEFKINPDPLQ